MHRQRQTNSRSQPTNGAGNRIEGSRDVVPESMGSSQPTPRLGNLNGHRRDVVPDTMASSQPTPRVGNLNMNRRRRDVVPDPIGSGSGMQADQSGSSQTLLTHQPSRQSQSPGPGETGVLARPPKRPRRTTIQTRANIEPEAEPDRQGHLETVPLSDDSSDEYHNPCKADETGSETEIDVDASDISFPREQHPDGVIGRRRLTDRARVNDPWCESQPPPDHRRYLSLDRHQQIVDA